MNSILSHFLLVGTVLSVHPLGNGLINDTYKVETQERTAPDYVLQRINHRIFQNVDMLQDNIEKVTKHLYDKLKAAGEEDLNRKVLRFVPTEEGKTYWFDGNSFWRVAIFIPDAKTYETVTPEYSYYAGKAFGKFQADLSDIPVQLGETIPDFHNMEFRLKQLHEAVEANPIGRKTEVQWLLDELEARAEEMCKAERLYREGVLPKRVCHCDTKVNNMMFEEDGSVLCVIDLDTVMPSFVFSDYGDFLRTAANTGDEDDKDLSRVGFDMTIFKAFTKGYLDSARSFLLPIEVDNLPYAAALFPYMQTVRFLADYINGDTYYKTQYADHNLVRAKAQFRLLQSVEEKIDEMRAYIATCLAPCKELTVKHIDKPNIELSQIPAFLDSIGVTPTLIDEVNWDAFPYRPEVQFRLVTTDEGLIIHYHVEERSVAAVATSDNGRVWEDSCVEFFCIPNNDGVYYNVECNCAGTLLVGAGKERRNRQHAPQEVLQGVKRWSSLGGESFSERQGPYVWDMVLSIPYGTFFCHEVKSLRGQTITANFYKCGDKLQKPHYLSWNRIKLPKPNFHTPEFFGTLRFE